MGGSSGGGGGQNTTVQTQTVPDYIQAEGQANQQLANNITNVPYPVYQGQLIAPLNDLQNQGIQAAQNASDPSVYAPYLQNANNMAGNAYNMGGGAYNIANATYQTATNPNSVASYMSPYIQAELQPSLQDLALQQASNQQTINSQATQAGAFGDARQAVQSALNNFYNGQNINAATAQAYGNAFTAANQNLANSEQARLQAATQATNAGNEQLQAASTSAGIGGALQQYGLNAANALYSAGSEQQQNQQTALNASYQQYLNAFDFPFQMLNVREGAIANNPYNIQTATTLPSPNTTAQGFGAVTALGGLLGSSGSSKASGT